MFVLLTWVLHVCPFKIHKSYQMKIYIYIYISITKHTLRTNIVFSMKINDCRLLLFKKKKKKKEGNSKVTLVVRDREYTKIGVQCTVDDKQNTQYTD